MEKILFILCVFVFLVHQFIQQVLLINIRFIDSYIDDVTCLPIIFYLISLERKWLLGLTKRYYFLFIEILVITIVVSLVFEFFLPYISSAFTYDTYDFVAYSVGAMLYYKVQNDR